MLRIWSDLLLSLNYSNFLQFGHSGELCSYGFVELAMKMLVVIILKVNIYSPLPYEIMISC